MSDSLLPARHHAGDDEVVLPRRKYGQWILSLVVLLVAVQVAVSVATNDNFQWDVVRQYFFTESVLHGLVRTLELTVIAMMIGIILGVPLAVMRQSANPTLRFASFAYVWFFRGTPLLVQIIFWFNMAALFPTLSLGIPFGPSLFDAKTNNVITPMLAAILALGLNQGAYTAEIIRSGLMAVDTGQSEAAAAIGMTRNQTLQKIVLPQAMRVIVPPMGSDTISMLKITSLVSVISLSDLLYSVQAIYQSTYQVVPLLLVASLWYLIVVTVLSIGQYYLERHFGRGYGALRTTIRTPREAA